MRQFVGPMCVLVMIVGCDTAHEKPPPPPSTSGLESFAAVPSPTTPVSSTEQRALAGVIDALTIASPYTAQPYSRAAFGDDWIDADHDCHNTRAEVLMVETAGPVTFNPNGCTVNTGQWTDPWGGYTSTLASDFQIDHTVPLADAWRSGAWAWTDTQRLAFANDLDHADELNALYGPLNTSKSDKTPNQWKPPLASSWCGDQDLSEVLAVKTETDDDGGFARGAVRSSTETQTRVLSIGIKIETEDDHKAALAVGGTSGPRPRGDRAWPRRSEAG